MSETSPPTHHAPPSGSHYQPRLGVVLVILVLFAAATYVMLRSSSPSSSTTGSTAVTTTTTSGSGATTTSVPKSDVRVEVANGTSTTGLAATYTHQLVALAWNAISPENGPKASTTVIYYRAGYEWAADEIAASLKVSTSEVKPIGSLRGVSGSSSDDVVVLLGPNLAK